MNIEDQAAALFARANPVPSVDLLDPIEPVDIDSIRTRSETGGELREPKTIQTTISRPGRLRLAPAMAMIAILVVAVPILVSVTPLGATPTPAEQVANSFMEALNEHDGLAIRGMFALEHNDDFNPDGWVALTDINRALGFEYTDVDCVELAPVTFPDGTGATSVECSWTVQQDLARSLGLEGTLGTYLIYVSRGDIMRAVESWHDTTSWGESFEAFRSWVERTHPDDLWTMFSNSSEDRPTIHYGLDYYIAVDPQALDLWEHYVDEFGAEVGG